MIRDRSWEIPKPSTNWMAIKEVCQSRLKCPLCNHSFKDRRGIHKHIEKHRNE